MTGNMIGFVIWAMVGVIIISLGIRAYLSGKVADFWANIKSISVNDIMGYNHAVGKLFVIYGAILIALGLPLLSGQNSPFILLSVLGVMIETIVIMVVYSYVYRYEGNLNGIENALVLLSYPEKAFGKPKALRAVKTNGTTDMGNGGRIGSEAGTKGKKHPKTAFHFPGKIILYEWCKLWLYQKI